MNLKKTNTLLETIISEASSDNWNGSINSYLWLDAIDKLGAICNIDDNYYAVIWNNNKNIAEEKVVFSTLAEAQTYIEDKIGSKAIYSPVDLIIYVYEEQTGRLSEIIRPNIDTLKTNLYNLSGKDNGYIVSLGPVNPKDEDTKKKSDDFKFHCKHIYENNGNFLEGLNLHYALFGNEYDKANIIKQYKTIE